MAKKKAKAVEAPVVPDGPIVWELSSLTQHYVGGKLKVGGTVVGEAIVMVGNLKSAVAAFKNAGMEIKIDEHNGFDERIAPYLK